MDIFQEAEAFLMPSEPDPRLTSDTNILSYSGTTLFEIHGAFIVQTFICFVLIRGEC